MKMTPNRKVTTMNSTPVSTLVSSTMLSRGMIFLRYFMCCSLPVSTSPITFSSSDAVSRKPQPMMSNNDSKRSVITFSQPRLGFAFTDHI